MSKKNKKDLYVEEITQAEVQKEEIEEQYRILKEEEEQEEKRKIFLLLSLFFMVFAISFAGASFSYISYKNTINSSPNTSIEEGTDKGPDKEYSISILFNAGTEFIAEEIEPGWESTASKDFKISNTGNLKANYNVVFKNIENTFTNIEDLRYTIKCNGEDVLVDQTLPTTESIILENQEIDVNQVNNYQIFFKYIDTNENQDIDINKRYKMAVDITPAENKQ